MIFARRRQLAPQHRFFVSKSCEDKENLHSTQRWITGQERVRETVVYARYVEELAQNFRGNSHDFNALAHVGKLNRAKDWLITS